MENKESRFLGKHTDYPETYDASLLVAVPRYENRRIYGIKDCPDIFLGMDVWHAYELGFITERGLPIAGMLKITYTSDNCYLVESKSLKLYLNSFNMYRLGNTREEGITEILEIIKRDLSKVLQTKVDVCFFDTQSELALDFEGYSLLEDDKDVENVYFKAFKETPELLQIEANGKNTLKVYTNLLRSNCKITHQPDWGTAYLHIKSNKIINKTSLLRYLVSFRNEYHFHEEVCEMIYKRLWDLFEPEELMVACLFTRRGGIDICPVRANKRMLIPKALTTTNICDFKLLRQ